MRVTKQPVRILEQATVSWYPASEIVELLNPPETGINFSLKESLEIVTPTQTIAQWGPFEIKEDLFERAKKQEQFLRGGGTFYKAVDFRTRARPARHAPWGTRRLRDGQVAHSSTVGTSARSLRSRR